MDTVLRLLFRGVWKAFAPLLRRLLLRVALRLMLLSVLAAVAATIGFRLLPAGLRKRIASLPSALPRRMMQHMPEG